MINDIEEKQKEGKSKTFIKNALIGLKSFLVDIGSNVVTFLITKGL